MPIYISSKQDLTLPSDTYLESNENELYLNDPDLIIDKLPQPFHFINKIINSIFNDAYVIIDQNNKLRSAEAKKISIKEVSKYTFFKNFGNIQCMVDVPSESNYVVAGLNNGLIVIDLVSGETVDCWDNDDMDVTSLKCHILSNNMYMLSVIDNNGSGYIVTLLYNRLFLVRSFPGIKDSDKPFQVTSLSLDENCGYIAVTYNQFKDNEQWVEMHKINREVWIKELESFGKSFKDNSVLVPPSDGSQMTEPNAVLDRTGVKVTGTTTVFKFKFLDSLKSTGINNFVQLHKQIDTTGSTIGMGMNHCLSPDYFQKINNIFQNEYPDSKLLPVNLDSNVVRISNICYSRITGSMIRDSNRQEGSESAMIFVWWSQSQHLLIYALNKANQKQSSDNWVKPDAVRTFSCPITALEMSTDNLFLGLGLQNGMFVLLDITTGVTRLTEQLSDTALSSIHFLSLRSDLHKTKGYILENAVNLTDLQNENKIHISITDSTGRMLFLHHNSATIRGSTTVELVSNEPNADYIGRLSKRSDLSLAIYESNIIVIRDMLTGRKLLKILLPENTNLISPWQPIFGCTSNSGYIIMEVLKNESQESDLPQSMDHCSVIYYLPSEMFAKSAVDDTPNMERKKSELNSNINIKLSEVLNKRYQSHEERQKSLQECWDNLGNILKSLS